MPRVTYETYRKRHLILRQLWSERQGLFILISPMEQWALHEYYLTTQPSLPHRAGKAYAALDRRIMAGRPIQNAVPTGSQRKGAKVLTVRSLVRPQPDMDLLVKTLISMVERRTAEEASSPTFTPWR